MIKSSANPAGVVALARVGGALFVAAFAALAVDIWRHARVA
ncbi:MAG TPA: hypothetical protein VJ301_10875 [Propionibacteriaceae bacterium]|nr:hypothetical protein [Propionibacteriaceae bacterium]